MICKANVVSPEVINLHSHCHEILKFYSIFRGGFVNDIDKWNPLLYLTVCCYNILDHERNEQDNLPNTFMNDDEKL